MVAKQEFYLVILITRFLKVFESLEEGGDSSAFATVEWGGTMKKTKLTKKPNINEHIYFHIPVEDDVKND